MIAYLFFENTYELDATKNYDLIFIIVFLLFELAFDLLFFF